MIFRSLAVCLALYSAVAFANGRKPAVEDFVGIEVEEAEVTPQGTESLYNLQQDISRIEEQKNAAPKAETVSKPITSDLSPTVVFGISFAIGLPLMVWFLVMAHLKKKASVESASNLEVLEKYRKEREKKSQESVKKAS